MSGRLLKTISVSQSKLSLWFEGKGTIEMAGTSKKKDVKSPQEIEEGIKSTQTVNWDPFTVFPKEIYLEVFDKLDKLNDKQNFMNAHVLWYDLFKSKRTLFLLDEVFGVVVGVLFKSDENRNCPTREDLHRCRLVCYDWDRGIRNSFELYSGYYSIDMGDEVWPPEEPLQTFRYECGVSTSSYFIYLNAEEMEKDLERFSVTHPSSKNPILPRAVWIFALYFRGSHEEGVKRYRKAFEALLERYGQHIWHCRLQFEAKEKLEPKDYRVIVKWLNLMPELKTLFIRYDAPENKPLTEEELKEIEDMELHQPEMANLVFLNSSYIPSIAFNKLFGNLKKLEKLQIRILGRDEPSSLKDFVLPTNRANLKEAFLTVKGIQDFKYLKRAEPFPLVETLVIDLEFESDEEARNKAYSEWPEWKMVFGILEEKFPAVDALTIRLPKAVPVQDKKEAINQSLECQPNLPKLKYLWIALPNLGSLDFLLSCQALKQLDVAIEHSEKEADDLKNKEKINFNMDLTKMQDSNIWRQFPKLNLLQIDTTNDCCEEINRYYYEKKGEEGVKKNLEDVHLHSELRY